jgi:hypothetical protein
VSVSLLHETHIAHTWRPSAVVIIPVWTEQPDVLYGSGLLQTWHERMAFLVGLSWVHLAHQSIIEAAPFLKVVELGAEEPALEIGEELLDGLVELLELLDGPASL